MSRYEKYELAISEKRISQLIDGIRKGMPIKYACDLAFIHERQYQRWMSAYKQFMEDFNEEDEKQIKLIEIPVDENDTLILKKLNILTLCRVLTHARADCMATYLENVKTDADHFQRWSWLLERTFRKEFGKDVVEENNEKPIEKIQVVYINPNDQNDRLEQLTKEVEENLNGKQ